MLEEERRKKMTKKGFEFIIHELDELQCEVRVFALASSVHDGWARIMSQGELTSEAARKSATPLVWVFISSLEADLLSSKIHQPKSALLPERSVLSQW